jgi:hypothetical protein
MIALRRKDTPAYARRGRANRGKCLTYESKISEHVSLEDSSGFLFEVKDGKHDAIGSFLRAAHISLCLQSHVDLITI